MPRVRVARWRGYALWEPRRLGAAGWRFQRGWAGIALGCEKSSRYAGCGLCLTLSSQPRILLSIYAPDVSQISGQGLTALIDKVQVLRPRQIRKITTKEVSAYASVGAQAAVDSARGLSGEGEMTTDLEEVLTQPHSGPAPFGILDCAVQYGRTRSVSLCLCQPLPFSVVLDTWSVSLDLANSSVQHPNCARLCPLLRRSMQYFRKAWNEAGELGSPVDIP